MYGAIMACVVHVPNGDYDGMTTDDQKSNATPSLEELMSQAYVTLVEGGKLIRKSSETIRRWIEEGRVDGYTTGPRGIVVPRAQLLAQVAKIAPDPEKVKRRLERLEAAKKKRAAVKKATGDPGAAA